MTTPGEPEYRLPSQAPEPVGRAEREAFAQLVAESLPGIRASALTWRNGLTALVSLVITGVVLQGRTTAADLPPGWRLAVTVLIAGGLVAAVVGLWQTLAAEAGTRSRATTISEILERYGSVRAYQVALANRAARRLAWARNAVAAALALLLAGVITTWWAPPVQPSPPAYLRVSYGTGAVACGTLLSGDGGKLRLHVSGAHDTVVIDLGVVGNVAVVPACPS